MKIFVVGCGRTGTCWVGRILQAHPKIRMTFEEPMIFPAVVRATILADPAEREWLIAEIVRRYRVFADLAAPLYYADKSHPALWILEDLAKAFPEARFVAITRNPVATVASMLNHASVLGWNDRPRVSAFLGTTLETLEEWKTLEPYEKCAVRWRAHRDRLTGLRQGHYGSRIHVVSFEKLVAETDIELGLLWAFLGLDSIPLPLSEKPDVTVLTKWQETLSEEQARRICELTSG